MSFRLPAIAAAVLGVTTVFASGPVAKSIVTYPWLFDEGTPTSRETAMNALAEIGKRNGYNVISQEKADAAYLQRKLPMLSAVNGPTLAQLALYGKSLGASYVVFGSISWHTRSIWVGAGPKTISTCTVDASVLDVATGKVSYSKEGVTGRSDEREDAVKLAAAVLITPLVTAVSGGPKTPQEQRAVQIALARAFANWNKVLGK